MESFFCKGKDQRGCGMIKEYGILFQSMAIAIEEMRNGRRQIDAVKFTESLIEMRKLAIIRFGRKNHAMGGV